MEQDFFVGKFARINSPDHPKAGERGQVVERDKTSLILRWSDGTHSGAYLTTVAMDVDQTTPVWPQPQPQ